MKLTKLRNISQDAIGIITLVCGFALMWGSTSGSHLARTTYKNLVNVAVDIDPATPSSQYNGKVVVAAATLKGDAPIEDEYIKPGPYLVLNRHVEMFQWIENEANEFDPPSYTMAWVEGQVDFFRFKNPQGHENPLLKLRPKKMIVEDPKFGGFNGTKILESVAQLQRLELTPAVLKDPAVEITNDTIYKKRDPRTTGAALGDMKIWYEYLPAGDYTILAVQQDEMSLLGARRSDDIVIQSGKMTLSEVADTLSDETQGAFSNMLYLGGFVLFFGLVTILRRVAPAMDLRPRINAQGAAAIVLVSAGVTVVTMIVFMILAMLG